MPSSAALHGGLILTDEYGFSGSYDGVGGPPAALADGLIVGGIGGSYDTSRMTASEERSLRTQLAKAREEVTMLRAARDADFAALTAKVSELEEQRSQMESHSKALRQELRQTQEEQREQHRLHTAKS